MRFLCSLQSVLRMGLVICIFIYSRLVVHIYSAYTQYVLYTRGAYIFVCTYRQSGHTTNNEGLVRFIYATLENIFFLFILYFVLNRIFHNHADSGPAILKWVAIFHTTLLWNHDLNKVKMLECLCIGREL